MYNELETASGQKCREGKRERDLTRAALDF
jgi:hypothetical protein